MESNYYRTTLIPTPRIDWQNVWNGKFPPAFPKWKEYNADAPIWSQDVYDKLNSIGFVVKQIRVFKWGQNRFYPWHVDGSYSKNSNWAINWVVNGSGQIQWNEKMTLHADPYGATFSIRHGTATDKYACQTTNSGNACIVKIDIPHRVVTLGDQKPRESISVLFTRSSELSFDDACKLLETVNLIGP